MAKVKGGEKLENHLMELSQKVSNASTLQVGFMAGATYPDGTPVALIAAIHNYGAPAAGIPPRPFFRNVVAKGTKTWGGEVETLLDENDFDAKRTLELMGERIKGQIQGEITGGTFKPLKPATVRRKGFDKPLIDTSHMLNSVDYKVS